jgi:hypothetical protein
VAEWSKAHAWNACRRETVSRVRIPVSPPLALAKAFSPSGHGRNFSFFWRVIREELSTSLGDGRLRRVLSRRYSLDLMTAPIWCAAYNKLKSHQFSGRPTQTIRCRWRSARWNRRRTFASQRPPKDLPRIIPIQRNNFPSPRKGQVIGLCHGLRGPGSGTRERGCSSSRCRSAPSSAMDIPVRILQSRTQVATKERPARVSLNALVFATRHKIPIGVLSCQCQTRSTRLRPHCDLLGQGCDRCEGGRRR